MLILRDAHAGFTRFDQFRKNLGIAPIMLTKRIEKYKDLLITLYQKLYLIKLKGKCHLLGFFYYFHSWTKERHEMLLKNQ